MKQIIRPTKTVTDVLEILKSDNVRPNTILDINSIIQTLEDREAIYGIKVTDNTVFEIPRVQNISPRVDKDKMISYYEYRLLEKPNGRKFYDEIILSSP